MNRNTHFGDRPVGSAPHLTPVSADELLLVTGGGFWGDLWDGIKSVATWVSNHFGLDWPGRTIIFKGKF